MWSIFCPLQAFELLCCFVSVLVSSIVDLVKYFNMMYSTDSALCSCDTVGVTV